MSTARQKTFLLPSTRRYVPVSRNLYKGPRFPFRFVNPSATIASCGTHLI